MMENLKYNDVVTGLEMPMLQIPIDRLGYYRIHFLEDGFPGQRIVDSDEIYRHPIFPIYAIDDYFTRYEVDPRPELLNAIKIVADAALSDMKIINGGLLAYYEANVKVARAVKSHPSGLTQGYYIGAFDAAYSVTKDEKYRTAARQVAKSLMVPEEKGGVARYLPNGCGIEEAPLDTPELILNGWQSALVTLLKSKDSLRLKKVQEFAEKNIELLKYLLPRYDCEDILNTRYSLASPILLRVRALLYPKFEIANLHISANKKKYHAKINDKLGWRNTILEKDADISQGNISSLGKMIRFSLVVTNCTEDCDLNYHLKTTRPTDFILEAHVGKYSPINAGEIEKEWVEIDRFHCGDEIKYTINLQEKLKNHIGVPTNFMKKFGGFRRNVYHPIHANRMWDLFQLTNEKIFEEYANKWADYTRIWKDRDIYKEFGEMNYDPELRSALRTKG